MGTNASSPWVGAVSKEMPAPLMSTGYVYYGARLLARMAEVLDKPAEKRRYEAGNQVAAPSIASSGMKLRADTGRITQSANSFALWLGIVPRERGARVAQDLVNDVAEHGNHLTTGNLCTKYLLGALA